ncbi:preprotein translocase subunit SecD [Mycobacterium sp. LTG2003]
MRRIAPSASPPGRDPARLVVVLVLMVVLVGYLVVVFLTKDIWAARDGTRLTFTMQSQDGGPPSPDAITRVPQIVEERLDELGMTGARAAASGESVDVTVPGRDIDTDEIRNVLTAGQLYVRPVIHAMAVEDPKTPDQTPQPPAPGNAQEISDEKQLRQSTDESIQILALQFQSTRCGEDDVLAGHDDPNLPLVTCSADGRTVYLLDNSVLGGDQIRHAESNRDSASGEYVVDVEFDEPAGRDWAEFTAANVGTQTAFTLDTKVVSAPEIMEAIPGGRTQITGNFDADSAREVASLLTSGSLPVSLTYESASPETLSPTVFLTTVRAAVIAAGIALAILVLGAAVYLLRRRPGPPAVL